MCNNSIYKICTLFCHPKNNCNETNCGVTKTNIEKSFLNRFLKKNVEDVENVQIQFCRYLLGVGTNTPIIAVLGECGRLPIFVTTYWVKLLSMDQSRLPKSA